MTDDLIARLSSDVQPVAPRALERRLGIALVLGLVGTIFIGPLVLDLMVGRPFGGAWGDIGTNSATTGPLGPHGFFASDAEKHREGIGYY